MPKRLTAALASLLMLASVLAVVPAAPASAHDIWHYANQKQQKCAYDPFAGNQCWTVTVRVKVPSHHSHAQVCPPGTTGTYPNCYPVPPTNTDPTPDNDWTDPNDDGTDTDTDTDTGTGTGTDTGTDTGTGTGTSTGTGTDQHTVTHFVTCPPVQEPLEVVQRHKHGVGGSCHRADTSHCSAGQIETGGHGAQNCHKTDAVDNIITRVQHLINQGTAGSLNAARKAIEKILSDLGDDALRNAEMNQHLGQELLRLYNNLPAPARITGTYLFCVGLAAAAVKAAPVTGGTSAAWFVTHAAGLGCTLGIEHYIPKFFSDEDEGGGYGQQQSETDAPPVDPNAPDPGDWTHDGGKNARHMCATYGPVAAGYFCDLVADYGQEDGQ
ncbi:MAG: hypothetical protein OXH86_08995 [Acidimicrobiaceae bacterium]|nr:hypothetical protein [Acidimicrobiaceae bacterium]